MLKFFARVIVMVAVALLALRIADRAARRADPLPDVPQPNGYDALLGAARKVTVPSGDLADLNADGVVFGRGHVRVDDDHQAVLRRPLGRRAGDRRQGQGRAGRGCDTRDEARTLHRDRANDES